MNSSTLLKCQKQYETGTAITWILREENKRILREIERYKKKKNSQMVRTLTQLSREYKRIISNLSNTTNIIMKNISDSFNTEEHTKNGENSGSLVFTTENESEEITDSVTK